MTRNRDAIARRVVGIGFVLPSIVTRGVLKAILKWQPMPCPHKVFQYEHDGAKWVRERIQQAASGAAERVASV